MLQAWRVIPGVNLWVYINARAKALGRALTPQDLEPITWAWMEEGRTVSAADYMSTVNLMHAIGRRVAGFLEGYDLILTPTLAKPTLKLGVVDYSVSDVGRYVSLLFEEIAPHTALFNQTGGAAMSVPLHRTVEGLPVGVQFAGGIGDEPKLIRLAAQLEQAQPWV